MFHSGFTVDCHTCCTLLYFCHFTVSNLKRKFLRNTNSVPGCFLCALPLLNGAPELSLESGVDPSWRLPTQRETERAAAENRDKNINSNDPKGKWCWAKEGILGEKCQRRVEATNEVCLSGNSRSFCLFKSVQRPFSIK